MLPCGSLAMRFSKSMSPRSPLQFQHLSFSDFQRLSLGLALFRVVLVEIRAKHPHQLLPKLFHPQVQIILSRFPP